MPLRAQSPTQDPPQAAAAVGILFADIAGSTRLYEMLGDAAAHLAVSDCLREMAEEIESGGGRLVKTIGDAVMGAFADAATTLRAGIGIRRRIAGLPPVPDGQGHPHRLRVRIGLHFGPALTDGDDWFGDTVNVAARLADLASAGQVLAAAETLALLPPDLAGLAEVFAEIEVKGRALPVRVARVAEPEAIRETTVVGLGLRPPAGPATRVSLTLEFAGRRWTLPPETRSLVIGRDPDCDLRLTGDRVSRRHATIERRRDRVLLIDHSSNGTWLQLGSEPPLRLSREEFALRGTGTVTFGSAGDEAEERLSFRLG